MSTTPPYPVVGKATEVGLPKHMTLDVVEVRGQKPNRTIILYEPCNKPGLHYVRALEVSDKDMKMFRFDGAWFVYESAGNSPEEA